MIQDFLRTYNQVLTSSQMCKQPFRGSTYDSIWKTKKIEALVCQSSLWLELDVGYVRLLGLTFVTAMYVNSYLRKFWKTLNDIGDNLFFVLNERTLKNVQKTFTVLPHTVSP